MCFINKRAINNLRIFKTRLKDKVRVRNKKKCIENLNQNVIVF